MFQRSMRMMPVLRSCSKITPQTRVQARKLSEWEILRPGVIRHLFRDMDRQMALMERDFFRNSPDFFQSSPLRLLAPRFIPVEGKEMPADSYRVNIDLQGYKPENIKVGLTDGVLKIEAKMEQTGEDGSRIQQHVVREFTLPDNVDMSSVKTLLHGDGILSIEATLGKLEAPKEIPIEHLEGGSDKPKSKL